MIKKHKPETIRERCFREEWERKDKEERIEFHKTMKSPCVVGRYRHRFRSPQTRSLTDDLVCWFCHKTVAQVKKEQKIYKYKKIKKNVKGGGKT